MTAAPLLQVRDLTVRFQTATGTVQAVDSLSFSLEAGQTLGIVGESGSGKTATAYALLQLHAAPPVVYPSGEVLFDGADLMRLDEGGLRRIRGKDIAMVFQDPMSSLNPVFTIGEQIVEAIRTHEAESKSGARARAIRALADVGIPSPEINIDKYPHEYSGGMLQRAMIAMALSTGPRLLIADEPTTALDVTIQAQILQLIAELQDRHGMAVLLITHDLGVIARLADRVLVMYAGRAVETGPTKDVFADPLMPYTWYLMRAVPRLADERESLVPIPGQIPSLLRPPAGCRFHPRCELARETCRSVRPALEEKMPGHLSACLLTPETQRAERPVSARRPSAVDAGAAE